MLCLGATDALPVPSSAISRYQKYVKKVYSKSVVISDGKFPSTPSKKYINLAVVDHKPHDIDCITKQTLHGNVDKILNGRGKMSIEEILQPKEDDSQLSLVLVEGPPGIGKSTLAWELCRRWDEIPSMRKFDLVVLLRLREEKVQDIEDAYGLFPHIDSDLQKDVAKEVMKNEGKGVLFILDGFDELPSHLKRDGLLVELIKGSILPECSVLVTSRPSATAEFLENCRSRVEKHVEILGFTQECVKQYASSIFSSEPKVLQEFLSYMSFNPVIESLMYIPLNAAIIVEVYRCTHKTGYPVPNTLTELYTQLSFTILKRFLESKGQHKYELSDFKDLPGEYYKHFLKLAEVAFNGLKKQKVIFHTDSVSRDLVHFDFLDSITALYGGGKVSFNFLHYTLQEFLAACYISFLPLDLPKVLEEDYCDERWAVVLRFVAGLTHFKYFKECKEFVRANTKGSVISALLINCLFEAKISFDFKHICGGNELQANSQDSVLTMYSLGVTIARTPPTVSWDVHFREYFHCMHTLNGINSVEGPTGIIGRVRFCLCSSSSIKTYPKFILLNISKVSLYFCGEGCIDDLIKRSHFVSIYNIWLATVQSWKKNKQHNTGCGP